LQQDGSWSGIPTYQFGKLKVMGFQDPLETPAGSSGYKNFSLTDQQKQQAAAEWLPLVQQNRPDVLLVHQSGLAELLARQLTKQNIIILTGHDHAQHVNRYGKAVVIDGGTVGAGGVLGAGRQYVGLAKLYFNGKRLKAVDMVRLEPIRGTGESQRVVLDDQCRMRDTQRCEYMLQSSPDHP